MMELLPFLLLTRSMIQSVISFTGLRSILASSVDLGKKTKKKRVDYEESEVLATLPTLKQHVFYFFLNYSSVSLYSLGCFVSLVFLRE